MNILVCNAQVPFVRGGAEDQADGLVAALRTRGHRAELVQLPLQWRPPRRVLETALAWRLLDLSESNGARVDRVITLKAPAHAVRHSHKIVWLVHLLRQAYDFQGTPLDGFTGSDDDRRVRSQLIELDRRTLAEAQGLFTTSRNNAARMERYLGLRPQQLYSPPRLAGRLRSESADDYILSVGRLDRNKRVDLLLRALARVPEARAVVAGDGPEAAALRRLAASLKVADRVKFCGRVDDDTLIDLYARARAVFFGPLDEDYGLVTVEAFMSARPVITTTDAGGVLEFVSHEQTGLVCEPMAEEIAPALACVYAEPRRAEAWGRAGYERVREITWEKVVDHLTA